jgi:hypothetical protein
MSLPNQLDYSQSISELPECTNYEVTLVPSTGAGSYEPGSVIKFDFQNRGFIDPTSITLRYSYTIVSTTAALQMIGTPVYTPFIRLETLIGSQVVESINQYNQVANLYTNTQMDVSQKYGVQAGYGYTNNTTVQYLENLDGRLLAATGGESGSFSAPLMGLLSSSAKLIPAFCMPQISVQLTMDALNNMFTSGTGITGVPSSIVLKNVEISYNMLDFGRSVELAVLAMPKIYLKCWSFSNSSAALAAAVSGSTSLVYNQKYASVKAAYVNFSGNFVTSANKWGDSYDVTSGGGDYSLMIAGQTYPQRPLSVLNNRAYIVQELRRASGNINDKNNSLSVNSVEFSKFGIEQTSYIVPAKFWLGIPLEKLHIPSEKAILTGVSTNNSNLTLNINIGSTQTPGAYNVNLILNYDAIIEVDTATKDARVRQ